MPTPRPVGLRRTTDHKVPGNKPSRLARYAPPFAQSRETSFMSPGRGLESMDVELLQALTATLCLLGEARCRVEGEVALVAAVIRDLRRVSRRPTSVQHEQIPEPAQPESTIQQTLQHIPAVHHLMHQRLPNFSTTEPAVHNAVVRASRSGQPAGRTTPATTAAVLSRPAAARTSDARLASGTARSRTQAAPPPAVSRANSSKSRGKSSPSGATRQAAGLSRSHAVCDTSFTQARAAAVAVAQAPVIPAPAVLPPEQQQDDSVALTELPSSFVKLLQQYSSLQTQVNELARTDQQQQAGITSSASAGFRASLQKAYSSSEAQPSQQQSCSTLRQLSLYDLSRQVEYVGLVSAALWAVQASSKKNTAFCSSVDHLQPVIVGIMQQCQHWLNQHAAQQQQQCDPTISNQQQLKSPDLQSNTEPQLGDVLRWRNRCLRSILSAAKSFETDQSAAAGARGALAATSADQQPAAAVQAGLWPIDCWKPLVQATAGSNNVTSNTSSSGSEVQRLQQILLPGWQAQQQRARVGGQDIASPSRLPMLYYADVQELIQHCRHLQKLQQLLLHQHIEAELAPRLIQCLVDGCKQLSQPDIKTNEQQCQGWNVERGLALYRLLYALTAAPAKRRGLGGGCHVVEKQVLDDVSMLQWL